MKISSIKNFVLTTKTSLIFVFANFLIQLVITMQIFTQNTVKATQVMSKNLLEVSVQVLFFETKIFALYAVFYLIVGSLQKSFSFRLSRLITPAIYLYAFILSAFIYPQLFDDMRPVAEVIKLLLPRMTSFSVYTMTLLFIAFMFFVFAKSKKTKAAYISLVFLALMSLGTTWSLLTETTSHPSGLPSAADIDPNKKSIVILSVDSLNGHFDQNVFENAPALRHFLDNSIHFENVITTQSQTHVSLASLFSEKPPQENGLRQYLDRNVTKDKEYYIGPVLKELKQSGYQLGFMMDTQAFALFERNSYFDVFFTPQQGIGTFVYPTMLRSYLFWLFLNNKGGEFIFPEIRYNADFTTTYNVRPFADFVGDNIEKLFRSNRPFILFVHTCLMHWPGSARYPYYVKDGNTRFPYYSYDSVISLKGPLSVFSPEDWSVRRLENAKTYNQHVKQAGEKFIEPILEKIDSLGAKNSIVLALTSDHGEDLWSDGKYPRQKTLTHVNDGLFGAKANRSAFYIRDLNPNPSPTLNNKSVFSITQSLKILKSAAQGDYQYDKYSSSTAFSEGPLFFSSYPDPFLKVKLEDLAGGMQFDASSGHFYFKVENELARLQQVRSVQDGQFQFSVYITNYGFQYFLCDVSTDTYCRNNLAGKDPQRDLKYLNEFNKNNQIDIEHSLYAQLVLDKNRAGFLKSVISDSTPNRWLKLLKAYEAYFKYFNVPQAKYLLSTIEISGNRVDLLREKIDSLEMRLESENTTVLTANSHGDDSFYSEDLQYKFMNVLEDYFSSALEKAYRPADLCQFLWTYLPNKQIPRSSFHLLLKKLDELHHDDQMIGWSNALNSQKTSSLDHDLVLKQLIRQRWLNGYCEKIDPQLRLQPLAEKIISAKSPSDESISWLNKQNLYRLQSF